MHESKFDREKAWDLKRDLYCLTPVTPDNREDFPQILTLAKWGKMMDRFIKYAEELGTKQIWATDGLTNIHLFSTLFIYHFYLSILLLEDTVKLLLDAYLHLKMKDMANVCEFSFFKFQISVLNYKNTFPNIYCRSMERLKKERKTCQIFMQDAAQNKTIIQKQGEKHKIGSADPYTLRFRYASLIRS